MKKLLAELKLFWLFGIKHNTGLAFHILGGIGFAIFLPLMWVIFIAVMWEVLEVILSLYKHGSSQDKSLKESWQRALIATKYKTTKNWVYDSLGDIVGALIGAL